MTVAQLIELLYTMPIDAVVVVECEHDAYFAHQLDGRAVQRTDAEGHEYVTLSADQAGDAVSLD